MKRLYVIVQYLLPHHLLSHLVGVLAGLRWAPVRRVLIRTFIRVYRVDLSEAEPPDPDAYGSFTEFFVRPLRQGARPLDPDISTIISPADGTLSQLGTMDGTGLVQAKGLDYTVGQLVGATELAETLRDGLYATIYLAPRNYHRVHAPLDGELVAIKHLPGRLFSVNPTTTMRIPGLFARNERAVMTFDTPAGLLVLVLVGAMIVGSIDTRWTGVVTGDRRIGERVTRGEEVAQFRMGSTVIVCLPKDSAQWEPNLAPGREVRFGERLATMSNVKPEA